MNRACGTNALFAAVLFFIFALPQIYFVNGRILPYRPFPSVTSGGCSGELMRTVFERSQQINIVGLVIKKSIYCSVYHRKLVADKECSATCGSQGMLFENNHLRGFMRFICFEDVFRFSRDFGEIIKLVLTNKLSEKYPPLVT